MASTVAESVVRVLADAGVRRGYTVPGESFLGLLDAFEADPRTTLVSTRHESGAAFMAEAEAKLTGVPAVAMASRGPGAANLAIGVHTAHQDRTPLVVLLGQVASYRRGTGAFQEVDLPAFFTPISKWVAEAERARDVPMLAAEALQQATSGCRGPAVLAVPTDLWSEPVEGAPTQPGAPRPYRPDPGRDGPVAAAREIGRLLAGARAPVVIAGAEARGARDELVHAAVRLGLGVYSAFRRQDVFPEDHPHYLGHLGLGLHREVLAALDGADVVLVLASRLDEITAQGFRYPLPHQRLVIAGPDARPPAHHGLTLVADADVRELLAAVAAEAEPCARDWSGPRRAQERFTAWGDEEVRDDHGVHPAEVVRALRRLVPEDTIVTGDAGNFSGFVHRYWCFTAPRSQLGPAGGAMGYAVPAAVAAKLAQPWRQVVAMVGDGGALMTGQEVETAVRHDAPIVVLAYQNGMYGTIAMHQARVHGRLAGVSIGPLDLAGWARSLGAEGFVLDRRDRIGDVLGAAVECGRPCVVDVRTDPDVITADTRLSTILDAHNSPRTGP